MFIWLWLYREGIYLKKKTSVPIRLVKSIVREYGNRGILTVLLLVTLVLIIGITIEEIVFRVIPSFFGLFGLLLANIIWAGLHILNFYRPEELRKIFEKREKEAIAIVLLFVEYFVLGLVFIWVYLSTFNYYVTLGVDIPGATVLAFLTTFITHFLYDFIIVSLTIIYLIYAGKLSSYHPLGTSSLIYSIWSKKYF